MYVFMLFQLIISPSWPFAVFSASLGREPESLGVGRNHHHHDDDHHPLDGDTTPALEASTRVSTRYELWWRRLQCGRYYRNVTVAGVSAVRSRVFGSSIGAIGTRV